MTEETWNNGNVDALDEVCLPSYRLQGVARVDELKLEIVFVIDPEMRRRLASRAELVDMEGYAVAYVCQRLGVPVRLVKHVSDQADDSALDWPSRVDASARVLGDWVARHC